MGSTVPRDQLKTRKTARDRPRRSERSRDSKSRASSSRTSTRQSQSRGGQQQKDVVQNFFRHLLHQGSPSEQRASRSSRGSRTAGGTGKHKEALRALETL